MITEIECKGLVSVEVEKECSEKEREKNNASKLRDTALLNNHMCNAINRVKS